MLCGCTIPLEVAEDSYSLDLCEPTIDVSLDQSVTVNERLVTYDGPYECDPAGFEQTFATTGLGMTQDFVVHVPYQGTVTAEPPEFDQDEGKLRSVAKTQAGWIPDTSTRMSEWTQLDVASGATITPTTSAQTAVPAHTWVTGDVTVAAMPTGTLSMKKPSLDKDSGELRSQATVTGGFVTGGNYFGSALILDKQAGATVTPTESEQTAVAQYRWTTGAVKVAAIPSQYIIPSGTLSITANGTGIDVTDYAAVDIAVPTFDALSWLGESAELVATYAKESTLLSSTSFNGWTPSTTAKTIKSGASMTAVAIDLEQYDYLLRWQFYCAPVYESSATNTARMIKTAQEVYQGIFRRPNSLANIGTLTDAGNACQTINTPSLMEYWNNNSSHTYTWSASYGIYAAATAATFASSTDLQTNLTPKRPSISARCSTTYQSTSNMGKITQASTYFYTKGWLYRIKKSKSLAYNQYRNVCTTFDNGI